MSLNRLRLEECLSASQATLQGMYIARLNHAANLTREHAQLQREIWELKAEALFLKFLIDHRADVSELSRLETLQMKLLEITTVPSPETPRS